MMGIRIYIPDLRCAASGMTGVIDGFVNFMTVADERTGIKLMGTASPLHHPTIECRLLGNHCLAL